MKFLILLLPSVIQANEYSLSQIQQRLTGNGPHKLLPYIIKGSEKITLNNIPISSEYYLIDYTNGVIYFNLHLTPQDTILCSYERLPINLPKEYYHRELHKSENSTPTQQISDSTPQQPNPPMTQLPNTSNSLSLIGTKTLGISIGSRQNPSFHQSMQISINGRLNKNTRIEGKLQDDGTPIQPDGTTQQLKEMDKIYVNVSNENNKLTIGDFDFNYYHSKFGKIERKLEGIFGKSSIHGGASSKKAEYFIGIPQTSIQLGGALSKGRWTRKEFTGITGKQGPYELCYQGIIVGGSEQVWVNGKLVQRGKDYTIDYAAGNITFTTFLPIEDGDKIVAEFQQKDESYRRTTIIGANETNNFNVLVFKEEDMKNHPLSFAITPERLVSLSKTDSSFAWISGATYVGDKKGSYIKIDSIYKYVGYSNGNYEVSFTRVKSGDYEFNPILGGYEYVGNGNGNYIPKIRVPLPQSNLLLDVGYEKEIDKIKVSIEGAATKFKPNAFASHEQLGKAITGQIEIGNSRYTIRANFKNLDNNFQFPGTKDTLEPKRAEIFSGITHNNILYFDTRLVKTPDDLKRGIGVKITPSKLPSLYYRSLLTKIKTINELGSYYRIKMIEPFIRYEITNYKDTSQIHITEVGVRSEPVNLSCKEGRKDHRLDNRTSTIGIYTKPLTLAYTYKQKFNQSHPSAIDLGNLRFNASGVEIAYDISSMERKVFEEKYYKVTPGRGSFSRDSITGRYYPDPHGDYEKMLIPMDKSAIYKNFKLSHGVNFGLTQEVNIKLGTIKQGEGHKIYLWKRTQYAPEDKNQFYFATKIYEIYANYTKQDYRANRTYGIMSHGDQKILEVNFTPAHYELIYTTRDTRDFIQSNLTWQERANTIGIGRTSNLLHSKFHFLIQAEERKINTPPYLPAHLYGLSGEPTVTYQSDNKPHNILSPKIITVRVKVINWFTKTSVPPNVRVIYPPGISTQWGIEFTGLAKYNYTISYQGNKVPGYPTEHTLNGEIRINF